MLTIGIDPGLTGAYAALNDGELLVVGDLPIIRDKSLGWVDGSVFMPLLGSIVGDDGLGEVVIERNSARRGQDAGSVYNFGFTSGSIVGIVRCLRLPVIFVTPAQWKAHFGLNLGKDATSTQRKRASLDKARLLFPTADLGLAKHHGRAEALLMAQFHQQRTRRRAA